MRFSYSTEVPVISKNAGNHGSGINVNNSNQCNKEKTSVLQKEMLIG